MKTPKYNLNAAKSYRQRQLKKGWRYFSKLVSAEEFAALQAVHERFKKN